MENAAKNFYRHFYMKSSGYIPSKPLNSSLFPGDFFQIQNGEIIVLGNIYHNNVIAPGEKEIDYGFKLNPIGWSFGEGVQKPYSGRGSGTDPISGEFEFNKQILTFDKKGSFIFHADAPEAVKITNWNELQQELIIRLTQTYFSFRELYVVTEVVSAAEWNLIIAGAENAEVEISGEADSFGLSNLFSHHSSKVVQSRDIDCYYREKKRKPCFFKAKKLAVREEKTDTLTTYITAQIQEQNQWANNFFDFNFEASEMYMPYSPEYNSLNILDMLPANELNPNTALQYFKWADTSLNDVEKLFTANV